jgi:hypothetical protein
MVIIDVPFRYAYGYEVVDGLFESVTIKNGLFGAFTAK